MRLASCTPAPTLQATYLLAMLCFRGASQWCPLLEASVVAAQLCGGDRLLQACMNALLCKWWVSRGTHEYVCAASTRQSMNFVQCTVIELTSAMAEWCHISAYNLLASFTVGQCGQCQTGQCK